MIHHLLRFFGWPFGLRFAPDGHVAPILRWGCFNRAQGPGFFWIIPLVEQTLPPIYAGGRLADLTFTEVISRDNIPFTFHLRVFFAFHPEQAPTTLVARLARLPGETTDAILTTNILQSYVSEELHNSVSNVLAEEICSHSTRVNLKRNLSHSLSVHLHDLGFVIINVLIQEISADEKFKHTMLNVEQHEAVLRTLSEYEDSPELIDKAMQTELLDSLEDRKGDLNFLSRLDLDYFHHHPRDYPQKPEQGNKPSPPENGSNS